MRIALIIYGSLETLSGGYLYDRMLVTHLRNAGHEVEIVSLAWRSYARHLLDNLGTGVIEQVRRLAPDVILQDELNHPSLFWLNRRLRKVTAAPIVSIVHHLRSDEEHPALVAPLYRRIEAAYLRSVDGFVWNSRTTQGRVAALRGESAAGVVAYPSVSAWVREAADAAQGDTARGDTARRATNRLLFVGNVIARKRLDVVLRALQNAPRAYVLDVVGSLEVDRAHAEQMRRLARSMQVEARVIFHDKVGDGALANLMRAADLLVVPSYEGFGIVYLEAMHFGVPVIAARAGAAHEIVREGINGFLVPLGDAAEITRLLHLVHADPALLAKLRRGALETPARFPLWEESGAMIERFLLSLLQSTD